MIVLKILSAVNLNNQRSGQGNCLQMDSVTLIFIAWKQKVYIQSVNSRQPWRDFYIYVYICSYTYDIHTHISDIWYISFYDIVESLLKARVVTNLKPSICKTKNQNTDYCTCTGQIVDNWKFNGLH